MSGINYSHQLDAKNRMRIPAKLREQLGPNYSITVGSGGCLYVYTEEQTKTLREKLNTINSFDEKHLKAARFVLINIWDAVEDKQGRILIPEKLRKLAKLEKNVLVYQGPKCVEIWSEEVWNDYFNDVDLSVLSNEVSL